MVMTSTAQAQTQPAQPTPPTPLVVTVPGATGTTPAGTVRRRLLLEQAVRASDSGNHAVALTLFTQAGQIQMRPGLRQSLAQEYRALGRMTQACEAATRCEMEARAEASHGQPTAVLQGCVDLVAAACGGLGRVRMHLPAPLPAGTQVSVNGLPVEGTTSEEVAAVSPGRASVLAATPGGLPFHQDVVVRPGEVAEVTVILITPDTRVGQGSPASTGSAPLRWVGIGMMGVGAAALVVGGIAWGITASQQASFAHASPYGTDDYAAWARYDNVVNVTGTLSYSDVCTRAQGDSVDPAAAGARAVCASNSSARIATLMGLVGGGVLGGAGALLYVLGRSHDATGGDRATAGLRVQPEVSAAYQGARVTWTF